MTSDTNVPELSRKFVLESGLINLEILQFWFSTIGTSANDKIAQDSVLESSLNNFSLLEYRIVEHTKKKDIKNKIYF